jgi:TatA/E family protein of Tat protein translocase
LVIALLVFGPKRMPEIGRQIGRGIRELKTQMNSITEDVRTEVDREPDAARPTVAATDAHAPIVAAAAPDDGLLDGVVVSGATGPEPQPPTES